jgi:hypothetical protein
LEDNDDNAQAPAIAVATAGQQQELLEQQQSKDDQGSGEAAAVEDAVVPPALSGDAEEEGDVEGRQQESLLTSSSFRLPAAVDGLVTEEEEEEVEGANDGVNQEECKEDEGSELEEDEAIGGVAAAPGEQQPYRWQLVVVGSMEERDGFSSDPKTDCVCDTPDTAAETHWDSRPICSRHIVLAVDPGRRRPLRVTVTARVVS